MRNVKSLILLGFIKICKPLVVYPFYCMALFHSETRRHMIKRVNIVHINYFFQFFKETTVHVFTNL